MIETKKVLNYQDKQSYIEDLTNFGWQRTETVSERHGRSTFFYQILARDKEMSNYNEYCILEQEYEEAKNSIMCFDEMDYLIILVLLLLFIIPGVLYIICKKNEKREVEENNRICHEKMQEAIANAKKIG